MRRQIEKKMRSSFSPQSQIACCETEFENFAIRSPSILPHNTIMNFLGGDESPIELLEITLASGAQATCPQYKLLTSIKNYNNEILQKMNLISKDMFTFDRVYGMVKESIEFINEMLVRVVTNKNVKYQAENRNEIWKEGEENNSTGFLCDAKKILIEECMKTKRDNFILDLFIENFNALSQKYEECIRNLEREASETKNTMSLIFKEIDNVVDIEVKNKNRELSSQIQIQQQMISDLSDFKAERIQELEMEKSLLVKENERLNIEIEKLKKEIYNLKKGMKENSFLHDKEEEEKLIKNESIYYEDKLSHDDHEWEEEYLDLHEELGK